MAVNGDQQRINTVVRAKSVLATFLCQVSPFEWERLYLFEKHEISYFARISCTTVEIQRKRTHVDCRRLVDQHLPQVVLLQTISPFSSTNWYNASKGEQ